jgi:metallo-beta-lactamase family protein
LSAKLSFYGAAGTVTGSKYLLETDRARILVDCGMFQGTPEQRERNWEDPPFSPKTIDAVVLTHAHTDHVGYLPRLVALGFRGPIYCTRATAQLAEIVLADSAKLMREEADFRNKKGITRHSPARPLFGEEDVKRTVQLFVPQPGDAFPVAAGIRARWRPVGHLLGARQVLLEVDGAGRILFSGDLGRALQPTLTDPEAPFECDYMLVESTYGDRRHPEADPRDVLAKILTEAHENGSTVLIPAFAMGRTQDLLYDIRQMEDDQQIPILPVRADSPMGKLATDAYLRAVEEHDAEMQQLRTERRNPYRTHSMIFASSIEDSKRLNDETGARVLIASSGMMTGGRVMHHARRVLPDPNAVLVFAGYQAEGTPGREILDGATEISIFKEPVPIRCKVVKIEGFSAHADHEEILTWLEPLKTKPPKRTFVVHGEPPAAAAMAGHLRARFGWDHISVPGHGDSFELG